MRPSQAVQSFLSVAVGKVELELVSKIHGEGRIARIRYHRNGNSDSEQPAATQRCSSGEVSEALFEELCPLKLLLRREG